MIDLNKYSIKMIDENKYILLEDEIKNAANHLEEMTAVIKKFPDAEVAYSNYASEFCPGIFSAASIKEEDDLKIRFWSDWYSLHVDFYAEVPAGDKIVKVHGKPINLNVWQVPSGILVIDDPHITWNHIDKVLPALGYNEKYLKQIYNKIILLMQKPVQTAFGGKEIIIRITNKE